MTRIVWKNIHQLALFQLFLADETSVHPQKDSDSRGWGQGTAYSRDASLAIRNSYM